MSEWIESPWGALVVIPLAVAILGGLASRDWGASSGASRVEQTARLLQLARSGGHDARLLQTQLEAQLAREVDRREVRRRAGWLAKVWWITAAGLWAATLIATQVWRALPDWWQWAYLAVALVGISVPNGRLATIEYQVREERSKGQKGGPSKQQPSRSRLERGRSS